MFSFFKTNKSQPAIDRKTTILITGGTGFAGSHLVERLLALGFVNIHVTSFASRPAYVHSLISSNNVHQINLTDKAAVFALLKKIKPQHIYHLAAISEVGKSFDEASKIIANNILLQLNILEAVRKITAKSRLLIVGSALEYDLIGCKSKKVDERHYLGPANPYGVSKVAQDLLALSYFYSYKLNVLRARPFNHIGERQTAGFVVSDFARQLVGKDVSPDERRIIKVGNLKAVRDFTDVKDMVNAYILLMEKGQTGEVYNVGSGMGYSMKQILDMLIKLSGTKTQVVVDKDKFRPLDVPKIIADNRKIAALGWQAQIPIEETLLRILNYWRTI